MKILISVASGCFLYYCLLCTSSIAQTSASSATAPTGANSPTASPTGNSGAPTGMSANPFSGVTPGNGALPNTTNNSPGNPLSGTSPSGAPVSNSVQPGQTGSPESQRVNALNQEYQNQQQRAVLGDRQRLNQQQQTRDINQLAPSSRQPGFGPLGVGVHSPVNRLPDREFGQASRAFDRGEIVNDLRQQGFAADDWRVVNQNGRWWFWSPDNAWLYYNNDGWVAYRGNYQQRVAARRTVAVPAGYPAEDWRLVQHDGRWWFWTPDQTWMYFNGGRWNDYPIAGNDAVPGHSGNEYGVGYRGNAPVPGGNTSPNPSTNPVRTQDEAGMNVDAQN